VTYWSAQQLWLHKKCKERGVVKESLVSPDSSFVLPLHIPSPEPGDETNYEEIRREHEVRLTLFDRLTSPKQRVGLVHRNTICHPPLTPVLTSSTSYPPQRENDSENGSILTLLLGLLF
jgi:hypothetical protein